MIHLEFFDCGASVVPTPHCSGTFPVSYMPILGDARLRTASDLEEEMSYFGIHRALTYNVKSYLLHPDLGNKELLEHISGHKGLYPSWVLLPEHTREMSPLPQLLKEMDENEVRAVRMNPSLLGHTLDEWSVGSILSALEDRKLPLFIDSESWQPEAKTQTWLELTRVCQKYPKLIVVASMTGRGARIIYPMMARYRNLYLSTSQFDGHHGIEEVVSYFGPERIVFGTYYPLSPAAQVNQLVYADIPSSHKQLIASGNLERILGLPCYEEVSCLRKRAESESSVMVDRVQKGLPLKDILSLDAHAHVGSGASSYRRNSSSTELISLMDRVGLMRTCISHYFGLAGDMIRGNDLVAAMVSKHPDRFIGFAVLDPNYPTEDLSQEIVRCFERLNFKGIKIHPVSHNMHLLDRKYEPVWKGAEKYGIPVLSHTTIEGIEGPNGDPKHFDILASRYPKVTFIMAHSGNCIKGLDICVKLAKKYQNIYLDTSGNATPRQGIIKKMVKEIGANKIIFGSDWTFFDLPWALGPLLYAKISDEDKKRILGENLARILKLDINGG